MFHVKPRSCLTELEGSLLKSEEHGDQSEHTVHCYACECLSDTSTLTENSFHAVPETISSPDGFDP